MDKQSGINFGINLKYIPKIEIHLVDALTGLGYTMTHSISRGSNSAFNDDVSDKKVVQLPKRKAIFTVRGE